MTDPRPITEEEFLRLGHLCSLFYDARYRQSFALLERKGLAFRLASRRPLASVGICQLSDAVFAVGTDESIALIDFSVNAVRLALTSFAPFVMFHLAGRFLAACFELEVVVVDCETGVIQQIIALPDVFVEIGPTSSEASVPGSSAGVLLNIHCMDGGRVQARI